jgi:2-deoxy-D-gluconate 3-dehydrogenase
LAEFGRADILVNNAGVQRRFAGRRFFRPPIGSSCSTCNAVFRFAQEYGRHMLAHGGGKIVNIASVISLQGGFTIAAYAAAKHGVVGITQALCKEWAGRGIGPICVLNLAPRAIVPITALN